MHLRLQIPRHTIRAPFLQAPVQCKIKSDAKTSSSDVAFNCQPRTFSGGFTLGIKSLKNYFRPLPLNPHLRFRNICLYSKVYSAASLGMSKIQLQFNVFYTEFLILCPFPTKPCSCFPSGKNTHTKEASSFISLFL